MGKQLSARRKAIRRQSDVFLYLCFTAVFSISMMGIVKLIWLQDQLISRDYLVTFWYVVGRSSFYTGVLYAQRIAIDIALQGIGVKPSNKEHMRKANLIGLGKLVLIDYAGILLALIAVFCPDDMKGVIEFTFVFKNAYGAFSTFGASGAARMMRIAIMKSFGECKEESVLGEIQAKVANIAKGAKKSAFVSFPISCLFAFWPRMWGYWAYFLPIQFCLIPLNARKLVKMLNLKKSKKKKKIFGSNPSAQVSSFGDSSTNGSHQGSAHGSGSVEVKKVIVPVNGN